MLPGRMKRLSLNGKYIVFKQDDVTKYPAKALVCPVDKDFGFDPKENKLHAEFEKAGQLPFPNPTPKLNTYEAYLMKTEGKWISANCEYIIYMVPSVEQKHFIGPFVQPYQYCDKNIFEKSLNNVLRISDQNRIPSLAVPALTQEPYNLLPEECAEVFYDDVRRFIMAGAMHLKEISLVFPDAESYSRAELVLSPKRG